MGQGSVWHINAVESSVLHPTNASTFDAHQAAAMKQSRVRHTNTCKSYGSSSMLLSQTGRAYLCQQS
jgi:hypothetical protein